MEEYVKSLREVCAMRPVSTTCLVLTAILSVYGVILALYRLYFSPLAKFPGPKLAALTHWYEVYYDLVCRGGGQMTFEIKRMHEKYGPVVRVNPDELHIDDPDFYSEVYCNSTPTKPIDKSKKFKYRFNIPNATFSTATAEHHRLRRAAIAPFFSKVRVRNLNENLKQITERISHRLSTEYAGTGRVLEASDIWGSMTADVITELAYGRSANFASGPDFKSAFSQAMGNLAWAGHWNAHFGFLVSMMNWVPDSILGTLVPPFKPILEYRSVNTPHPLPKVIPHINLKSNRSPNSEITGNTTSAPRYTLWKERYCQGGIDSYDFPRYCRVESAPERAFVAKTS